MPRKPTGTVTLLLTDIERSTELLQRLGDSGYARLLVECRQLIRSASRREGGREFGSQGDALLMVFPRARDAVAAAIAAQGAMLRHAWPGGAGPAVRMGLHTGEPGTVAGEYVGLDVHRTARVCAAGHGGQILLSTTTGSLVRDSLPEGAALRSLGSHRLKGLQHPEQISQIVHPDLPDQFPPPRSLDAFPNNLPRQLTIFVGREREIAEVKRLLSTARILMLTGSGGCGKTRLALEVAADLIDAYSDGVWLVELAALAEPDLVLHTMATALGVREVSGRTLLATLIDYLQTRELLLVLDNCEHLLAACASLVESLARACPRLRVLATSREPLGIPGETVWRVPSLSLPDPGGTPPMDQLMQYEAIRLFIERAASVQPAFALTSENARTVVAVCRRLDGIPLAIELAAARMRALSVDQIAARLDERFKLLTGGARTALPRHQTLRGALDWSYDLLSPPERALLRRLSVFAGGWTLEAAEVVGTGDGVEGSEILDLMTQLVFKSLVLMDTYGAHVRYRLLETVRQYGRDRLDELGEGAGVRTRQLHWFLGLVERAEPELSGADQSLWLDRLEEEHDNLRAALEWSKAGPNNGDMGLRLARGLWQFWYVRGHYSEGRAWLETTLAHSRGASASERAKALAGTGFLADRQGDYGGSITLCTESLNAFRGLGDRSGMAQVLHVMGMVAEHQGDYDRAKSLFMESLDLGRQTGDKRRMAISLNAIGEVARCQEGYAAARSSYEESLVLSREIGDKRNIAIALGNLGHVALHQADHERAAMLFRQALGLAQQLVYRLGIAEYLAGLGGVAAAEGRYARAARLLASADYLLGFVGGRLEPADRAEYERSVAAIRASLGEAEFEAAWTEGNEMPLEQAIQYALSSDVLDSDLAEKSPIDRTR